MTRIAATISYLFHPLLMVTYALLLYYAAFPPMISTRISAYGSAILVGFIFLTSYLIPGLSVFLLTRTRKLRDLQMESRNERLLPILYTAVMYMVMAFMLINTAYPDFIIAFQFAAAFGLLVAAAINLRRKISLHMIGAGGLAGGLLGLWMRGVPGEVWALSLAFLICGLAGTARLILRAHRPQEIYTGFLLGFGLEFLAIFFFGF